MAKRAVSVDGSILEGGGQILRVSMALSSLLSIPLEIKNIRGNRPKPGLAAQHLTSVSAASAIVNGHLEGCEFRSSTLSFHPDASQKIAKIAQSRYLFEIDTAGAVSLVIQAMLPGFLFGTRIPASPAVSVSVVGGTNVAFSPPIDHTIHVLLPLLRGMGVPADTECRVERRGWNPRGGGKVTLHSPSNTSFGGAAAGSHVLRAINLSEPGTPVAISGVICSSTNNMAVMEAGRRALERLCRDPRHAAVFPTRLAVDIRVDAGEQQRTPDTVFKASSSSSRSSSNNGGGSSISGGGGGGWSAAGPKGCEVCVQLWVDTSTGARLSRNVLQYLKKPTAAAMEAVCENLFASLAALVASGAAVDEHTADQLLVFMALGGGRAPSQLLVEPHDPNESSLHMETTIFILEKFVRAKIFELRAVGSGGTGCRLITCTPVPVSM